LPGAGNKTKPMEPIPKLRDFFETGAHRNRKHTSPARLGSVVAPSCDILCGYRVSQIMRNCVKVVKRPRTQSGPNGL
jgi:hypothetical protein